MTRVDTPLPVKEIRHLTEKRRIGDDDAKLISDGETISVDSGSTTAESAARRRKSCKHAAYRSSPYG